MTDNVVPFPASDSERARRAFLARVEAALPAAGGGGLVCEYPLIPPHPDVDGPRFTGLVVTRPGVAGEARVCALALVRHMIGTLPRDVDPELSNAGAALEMLRAQLWNLGIAGVAGDERRYDPFPGDGTPTYELTIGTWDTGLGSGDAAQDQEGNGWQSTVWEQSPDPQAIARRIATWFNAVGRRYAPEPRDASSLAPLRATAQARQALLSAVDRAQVEAHRQAGRLAEAWRLAGLHTALDPERLTQPGVALTPDARERLRADLAALLPLHLQWHYPRDERGRLLLGTRVLLAAYASATPLSQGRELWLSATAPARRREPQVVTLELAPLIGENHTHVWAAAPWLWDARAQDAPREARWGVAALPLERLGWDGWQSLPAATNHDLTAAAPAEERAARCILLQDAGRLREALALYDVALDDYVGRLLDGERIRYVAPEELADWARTVQEAVRGAALWRFGPLLRDAAQGRARWVAEKRSRKWSPPTLRLFWLPHQTQQSKAAVLLRSHERDGSRPRLEMESSASNARLPAVAWERPLEIDLLRFGLLAESDLP